MCAAGSLRAKSAPCPGSHINGYTQTWWRLDGQGLVHGGRNVLAVSADAYAGQGMWYEGGGLTRHQRLVHTAGAVYMPPDRSWAHANLSTSPVAANGALPADGDTATGVAVTTEVLLVNTAGSPTLGVVVTADIVDTAGGEAVVASAAVAAPVSVGAGGNRTVTLVVVPASKLELWSVARPYLYTAAVTVTVQGAAVDAFNMTFGARKIELDPDTGMWLNGRRVKMRGFCDHSSFGGVGGAVPDRVNLYRAQMIRAVGGNAWRMAHNPPIPARLEITDALGMLALDENHYYGGHFNRGSYTPEGTGQEDTDMSDLVRRDRSHASVWMYNACNEVGCDNETAAGGMRAAVDRYDTTRGMTMNHLVDNITERYVCTAAPSPW